MLCVEFIAIFEAIKDENFLPFSVWSSTNFLSAFVHVWYFMIIRWVMSSMNLVNIVLLFISWTLNDYTNAWSDMHTTYYNNITFTIYFTPVGSTRAYGFVTTFET